MKKFLLALPPAFLLLSLDRLGPATGRPPVPVMVASWDEAAPALPAVDEGRGGKPGDPLNIVFVATPQTLRRALTEAGWTEVPRTVRGSLAAGLSEILAGRRLASFPPLSDYRLRGRRQDMNWALPAEPLARRRRFRLWWTGMFDRNGRGYWWGSGSRGSDPDRDRERDFVLRTLSASPLLETAALMPLPSIPLEGVNDRRRAYRTDGRVGVIVLRSPSDGVSRRRAAEAAGSSSSSWLRARTAAHPPRPTRTP